MAGRKTGRRLRIKVVNKRNKVKRKRVKDARVVGILDRRVPIAFRQSDFISISLAKFVVLSTGVNGARLIGKILYM